MLRSSFAKSTVRFAILGVLMLGVIVLSKPTSVLAVGSCIEQCGVARLECLDACGPNLPQDCVNDCVSQYNACVKRCG